MVASAGMPRDVPLPSASALRLCVCPISRGPNSSPGKRVATYNAGPELRFYAYEVRQKTTQPRIVGDQGSGRRACRNFRAGGGCCCDGHSLGCPGPSIFMYEQVIVRLRSCKKEGDFSCVGKRYSAAHRLECGGNACACCAGVTARAEAGGNGIGRVAVFFSWCWLSKSPPWLRV